MLPSVVVIDIVCGKIKISVLIAIENYYGFKRVYETVCELDIWIASFVKKKCGTDVHVAPPANQTYQIMILLTL